MLHFLREVFSEDGQGSFSRVASAFHVAAAIGWGTYFVYTHGGAIPDTATLIGLAGFATVQYAANKTAAAISSFSEPK